jgi:ASC-1-like (ASCH) protein
VNYHLVILKKPYLDLILTGRKTVESRFTKTKCAPFGQISAGDKLFLKESSGPVCALATVSEVRSFDNLCPHQISRLKQQYNHLISGSDAYWRSKADCRFGLLVWLENVRAIEPVQINKKDWRAWVILKEKEDFGLLNKRCKES